MRLSNHWNSHIHENAYIGIQLIYHTCKYMMYLHDMLYSCWIRRAFWDHPHVSFSLIRVNQHDLDNHIHMHYRGLAVNTLYVYNQIAEKFCKCRWKLEGVLPQNTILYQTPQKACVCVWCVTSSLFRMIHCLSRTTLNVAFTCTLDHSEGSDFRFITSDWWNGESTAPSLDKNLQLWKKKKLASPFLDFYCRKFLHTHTQTKKYSFDVQSTIFYYFLLRLTRLNSGCNTKFSIDKKLAETISISPQMWWDIIALLSFIGMLFDAIIALL